MITAHSHEDTFVTTNAVNKAFTCVNENGIIVLIGSPGTGKSRIGVELLKQLSIRDERLQSIQLDDISQWLDFSDGMDAVFIDDVFGRTNCSYNDDIHSRLLDIIFTSIENKTIKVILTLRKNIYQTVIPMTESHRIFHDHHVLDLSSNENEMTVEERKLCLMNYFEKNKIMITDDLKKENIGNEYVLGMDSTVYLYKDTVRNILDSDIGTQIGFPETCYLFASHRKFTRQGHIFFCHPSEKLLNEIENLRLDGKGNESGMIDFTLLIYILLNGGSIDIHEVDLEIFLWTMKTMYLNPPANIPILYINDSAKRLLGKYLKINSDGNYIFQHRLIYEAVMISYSVTDPGRVIPLLGFDFITEMARPQSYKPSEGEVTFSVPTSCYSLLAQRLRQLLQMHYKREPFQFIQNLCKSKIITKTSYKILQEMVKQYEFKKPYHVLEFLSDHRFSGRYTYYYINTPYFYFPSALMMFCNIDPVDQCLYDNIHNALASGTNSDITKACEESLMESLNFALCTLDEEN